MAYLHKLHPEAQREYEDSVLWYLERSLKAASDFVKSIDRSIELICQDPEQYRKVYKSYHEFTLRRYPFTIIYTIEESQLMVIIIAVYHQKRQQHKKYR